jgi:competence protein ComEC
MAGSLEIVIWNVQHGSAMHVRTPSGRRIILDAGSSEDFSPTYHLYKNHGVTKSDLFILSHPHADHVSDTERVDKLINPSAFHRPKSIPSNVLHPNGLPTTGPAKYYEEFNARYSQPIDPTHPLHPSNRESWGNVRIEILDPAAPGNSFSSLNDYSMVTILLHGNLEFLFPGDLEAPGWQALMATETFRKLATPSSQNPREIRILIASHHGHSAGVYKPFLDLYKPHLTIISGKYEDPHTDSTTYYQVTQGFPVRNSTTGVAQSRYVISTKVNDWVRIEADLSNVSISAPS